MNKCYAICIPGDSKRRLHSVSHTCISFNIGEGYMKFPSMIEAKSFCIKWRHWSMLDLYDIKPCK